MLLIDGNFFIKQGTVHLHLCAVVPDGFVFMFAVLLAAGDKRENRKCKNKKGHMKSRTLFYTDCFHTSELLTVAEFVITEIRRGL